MKRYPPDEKLLEEFRGRACEVCGRGYERFAGPEPPRGVRSHPHHILGRGMGGGRRIDHRLNLVSLCLKCHDKAHHGQITKEELLAIVARREGCTPEFTEQEVNRIRRG